MSAITQTITQVTQQVTNATNDMVETVATRVGGIVTEARGFVSTYVSEVEKRATPVAKTVVERGEALARTVRRQVITPKPTKKAVAAKRAPAKRAPAKRVAARATTK